MMTKQTANYTTRTRTRVEIRATDTGKILIALNGEAIALTANDARDLSGELSAAATECTAMSGPERA